MKKIKVLLMLSAFVMAMCSLPSPPAFGFSKPVKEVVKVSYSLISVSDVQELDIIAVPSFNEPVGLVPKDNSFVGDISVKILANPVKDADERTWRTSYALAINDKYTDKIKFNPLSRLSIPPAWRS